MQTKIKPWGNSQGIRISKEALAKAGIGLNDTIEINAETGVIYLRKAQVHKTLEERTAKFGGKLSFEGKYDWGTPKGKEYW